MIHIAYIPYLEILNKLGSNDVLDPQSGNSFEISKKIFQINHSKSALIKYHFVAASQPANRLTAWPYAHSSHLTPPPPHMGSRVGQPAFQSRGRSNRPALTIHLSCIYSHLSPNKARTVYSEPLSVAVPVVLGPCTVLVGTVESVPVPPQFHQYFCCLYGFKFTILKMPKNHHVENIFPLLEIWTNMGVKTHNFRILSRPKKPWRKIASNRFFFLKMIFCGSWIAGNFTAEHYLFLDSLIFFFGFKTTNTVHSTFLIHILTF